MSHIHGFPPISDRRARILILGSMPSRASLMAGQYYAHPHNAFWRIMESLFGIDRTLPYHQRSAQLIKNQVALWDVLKTCTRTSSLDSDIVDSSIVTNDFEQFFSTHNKISAVYFNGAMAEKVFLRYILPQLPEHMSNLAMTRLPSTSPANASLNFEAKLKQWEVIKTATSHQPPASRKSQKQKPVQSK